MKNQSGDEMTNRDIELEILAESKKSARKKWLEVWREKSFGYRFTHNDYGESNYGAVFAYFMVILLMVVVLMVVIVPMYQLGGIQYHLQNGIVYSSPSGDWHGTTHDMIMQNTDYGRLYYSPTDGRLIGEQPYSDALPL